MFDEFLRERAEREGDEFVPFDAHDDYDEYVDGKPRADGVRSSSPRAASSCRGRARRSAGRRDRRRARQPQERPGPGADPRRTGVEAYEGSVRYAGGRARRGPAHARSSPPAPTAATCCERRRDRATSSRTIVDGVVAERARACAASRAPDTFLAGAAGLGVAAAEARGLRGRARRRGGGPRGRLRLRRRRRPRRPGRGAARARRRRRRQGPRRAARRMITPRASYDVEPWASARPSSTSTCLAQSRVRLRALQRPHRPARQPRRGRAARAPRHLPQRLLRDAAAALRRGRLRLPGGGPDASSTSPTARSSGCSSTTSRSTSATASCAPRARARPARRDAHPRGRVDLADRAARSGCARPGSSPSPSGRSPRSPTRSSRSTSRPRVVLQSELVTNEPLPASERRPARRRGR